MELISGKELKLDGVFVEIGSAPNLDFLKSLKLKTDEKGYIIVNENQETNIHGFYAAGDITNNNLKQIITAGAGGAVAAYKVYQSVKGGN